MASKTMRCFLAALAVAVLSGAVFTAAAESAQQVPYESYTYWEGISESERKAVYNRPMYETAVVLSAEEIGVEAFSALNDVCTDTQGNVYLLDNTSRIIVLDSDYKLVREIGPIVDNAGEMLDFSGAKGLYAHTDGTLYICDTEHARLIHCTGEGAFIDICYLPDSPLIPEDFLYRPLSAVMDSSGYLYVLSDGSYYGALLYAPDGSFSGFFGANTVRSGVFGTLTNIWNRLFLNDAKKAASSRKLPYVFVDLALDDENFLYTATGYTEDYERSGQIRRLSPGTGNNILHSEDINFTDDAVNTTYQEGRTINQDIISLAVDDRGFIYCLESQFGRVLVYDRECHMLTAFGGGMGEGTQKGTFRMASSIALREGDVLVGDSLNNTLTVFRVNDFGERVQELTALTLDGNYLETKAGWQEVMQQDRSLQAAYRGLARAYLTEGDYRQAMAVAREGYDRDTYALAFEMYRQDFLGRYFWLLLVAGLVLAGGLAVVLIVTMRRKVVLIKNDEARLLFSMLTHPVINCEEISEKKRGSLPLCGLLVLLFYIFSVLQILAGGFLFTYYDPESFNSFWVLVRSVGVVVLWIICNWMVCTLLGGRGRLREITVVTCYSLLPLIIEKMLLLVLTNILLPTEAEFLGILDAVAVLFMLVILVVGMIKIHDFSMSRFIGTSVLTLLAMAAMVFLIIMVGLLLQQLYAFIATVCMELLM